MGGITLFIPKEQDDARVAATPSTVKQLIELGIVVHISKGAGEGAFFSDEEYIAHGGKISSESDISKAAIVASVNPLSPKQIGKLKKGCILICMLNPSLSEDTLKRLAKQKVDCFSLTFVPRISRAQKMDALSSQSNLTGYKAVLLAANALSKALPLQMTAAGTLQAARVVVIGAGVAGLSAIATAKRLGGIVEASDVRPAAKEQVESLGASFIEVAFEEGSEDTSGYAKEASKEYLKRQAEEVSKRLEIADIVITTALVPGKKAPVLISKDQVSSMKNGSVIVDLAAIQGGNCAFTEPGRVVVKEGVTIIGEENIPGTIPQHASEVYAKNILHFISGMVSEGTLHVPEEDEIYKGSILIKDGSSAHSFVADILGGKK